MRKVVRNHLIEMRLANGMTQKDVANIVGITTSYYGMIEQGARTPKLNIAQKIASIFERKVDEIFFNN